MSQFKGTPGWWFIAHGSVFAPSDRVETRGPVRVCDVSIARKSSPERDANARLIAAAPDLLAACKELVANLRAGAAFGLNESEVAMLVRAEDAIAKATQTTPPGREHSDP